MDTTTPRALGDIPISDLEIVGFNSEPVVQCGQAFAVARRKSTDLFFPLTKGVLSSQFKWYHRMEIEQLNKEGHLTLLPHAVPVPIETREDNSVILPRVAWVSESLFQEANFDRPPNRHAEVCFDWQLVPNSKQRIWAACVSGRASAGFVDHLAELMRDKADDLIAGKKPIDWNRVERISDLGLCAADAKNLRYELWTRYLAGIACSSRPEKARKLFDFFVCKEFPGITWEKIQSSVDELQQSLNLRHSIQHPGISNKFRGIARELSEPKAA